MVANAWLLMKQTEMPSDDSIMALTMIVMEYISKYMLLPGQVENCLTVIDLNDQIMGIPVSKLKSLMSVL